MTTNKGGVSGTLKASLGGGASVGVTASGQNGGRNGVSVGINQSLGNVTANLNDRMNAGSRGSLGGGLNYTARSGGFSGNYGAGFQDNSAPSYSFGGGYSSGRLSSSIGLSTQSGYLTASVTTSYHIGGNVSLYQKVNQHGGVEYGISFR